MNKLLLLLGTTFLSFNITSPCFLACLRKTTVEHHGLTPRQTAQALAQDDADQLAKLAPDQLERSVTLNIYGGTVVATPLLQAVALTHAKAVRQLLLMKANTQARDGCNRTALELATLSHNHSPLTPVAMVIISDLLEHGADIGVEVEVDISPHACLSLPLGKWLLDPQYQPSLVQGFKARDARAQETQRKALIATLPFLQIDIIGLIHSYAGPNRTDLEASVCPIGVPEQTQETASRTHSS